MKNMIYFIKKITHLPNPKYKSVSELYGKSSIFFSSLHFDAISVVQAGN
jgi:hypothetical protein